MFIMADIRCHGSLVYLVPILLKLHTLIAMCNRGVRYFLWNFSNRFQNCMPGWKLGIALLHVNIDVCLCDIIFLLPQIFIVYLVGYPKRCSLLKSTCLGSSKPLLYCIQSHLITQYKWLHFIKFKAKSCTCSTTLTVNVILDTTWSVLGFRRDPKHMIYIYIHVYTNCAHKYTCIYVPFVYVWNTDICRIPTTIKYIYIYIYKLIYMYSQYWSGQYYYIMI